MTEMRIAIIDDDPFVLAHLKSAIRQRLPDVEVTGVIEPVAPAGFDVYIVDQDFEGNSQGQEVVQRIRSIAPDCLVLAYSAHLDRDFLRSLLREGCEGAFDKSSLEELDAMIDIIAAHYASGRSAEIAVRGIGSTARAISGLLKEWNLRLANNGRAYIKNYSDA